jgi:hypothetical protein
MNIPKENLADANESVQSTPKGKKRAARLNATSEALPTLPLAPTLAPVPGIKEDSKGTKRAARLNATSEALPTLPLAPTLAPILGITEDTDLNGVPFLRPAGMPIVRKALEAIPIGSTIVFATKDIGALFLTDTPIAHNTEAYRKVEYFAQACNCSFSLQETAGTIAFRRR